MTWRTLVGRRAGRPEEATIATDGGGVYRFGDLVVGGRVVRITVPGGFTGSTVEQAINVAPGVTVRSANFALRELGSIAGMVFEDLDGSGRQEPGEPGVGGITVDLLAAGAIVQTTASDQDGLYRFTGLTAGSYVLRITLGADYVAVVAGEQAIDLVGGSEAGGYSFGVQRKGSLSGTIYHDRNGNDRVDPGEQGIADVTVTLVNGGGNTTAQTDADGRYVFSSLLPGLYQVQIPALGGWIANGAQAVSVNLGSSGAAIASFGFQAQGAIGGVVFQDMDGDAVQSDGEAGVAGVAVQVLQNSVVITTTTSGPDGRYRVGGLTPGAYLLRLLAPGGFAPVTPVAREVLLPEGGAVNVGFGLEPLSTIGGSVYDDANGDGARQAYEQGLGSVTVALFTAGPDGVFDTPDDVQAGAQSTAGDGAYQFLDQVLNAYSVRVAAPGSYTSTTPSRVVVNLAQGWVASANFGLQASSSVAGMTFEDLNGNGARDPNEVNAANAVGLDGAENVAVVGVSHVQTPEVAQRDRALFVFPDRLQDHPEGRVHHGEQRRT